MPMSVRLARPAGVVSRSVEDDPPARRHRHRARRGRGHPGRVDIRRPRRSRRPVTRGAPRAAATARARCRLAAELRPASTRRARTGRQEPIEERSVAISESLTDLERDPRDGPSRSRPATPGRVRDPVRLDGHAHVGVAVGQPVGRAGDERGCQPIDVQRVEVDTVAPVRTDDVGPHVRLREPARGQPRTAHADPDAIHDERHEPDVGPTFEQVGLESFGEASRDAVGVDVPMQVAHVAPTHRHHGTADRRTLSWPLVRRGDHGVWSS
jgi:hypothetical protein